MQKFCLATGFRFETSKNDLEFYKLMGVPSPALCPDERARRRLAWRNERNMYRRGCDKTGKSIISIHSPDKPYPVFSQEVWWSDDWDPKDFGCGFDFSRPFFEQFMDLYRSVPQLAINNAESENCEFTNQSQRNKNCYLIVASNYNEDCLYGMWYQNCRNCLDCLYLEESELCYEVVNGKRCYNCRYGDNLENCSDCFFCKNCIGCKSCFGCVNLRNKEFYWFNERLSKEEFIKRLKQAQVDRYSQVKALRQKFEEHKLKFAEKYFVGSNTENFSGDYVQQVKDSWEVFNCRHCERIKFCRDAWRARNCYDLTETLENDYCLELEGCDINVDCAFSMKIHETSNTWYSSHCFFSKDLFACVGLRQAQYCILNRQYSKQAYQELRAKIVDHMKGSAEWGEFFPMSLSPFAYNETVAQEYFPMKSAEALAKKLKWSQPPDEQKGQSHFDQLPDSIECTAAEVCKEILSCNLTERPYRILHAEFKFYQDLMIPIPRLSPESRHQLRMQRRNPRTLYTRTCDNCGKDLMSTYGPDSKQTILCEGCYFENLE